MNWESILRFKCVGVVLALALIVTIPVGYVAATERDYDWDRYHESGDYIVDPIRTDAGYISGSKIDAINDPGPTTLRTELFGPPELPTKIGEIGKVVRIYRGIPYAAPPVGDLRWKPPQPVTPWKGIRECTVFSPMAPQPFPSAALYGSIPESGMSEDCLYLNVLTPAQRKDERLPVMVWFHGGGITTGSSNPVSNNSPPLPQHGVVSVTVQHRIGPLGYMCHPALAVESGNVCGNYGQLDLIAALQWVRRNIAAFGGDPHNVTIWGESGGGQKVLGLMASPLAKGLFHRVICESGGVAGTPLATAEQMGVNLANKLGASTLAALRAETWENIIIAANTPGSGYSSVFTVDGYFLLDTETNIFATDRQNDVPLMIGMNGQDITRVFSGTEAFVPTIKQHSKIYAYLFNHVPDGWKGQGVNAFHGLDVAYEFGFQAWLAFFYNTLFFPPPSVSLDPGLNQKDEYVAEAMMTMWTQFAATGDPSVKGLVKWPAYDPHTDQYLYIDDPLQVKSGFSTLVEPTANHWGL